MPEIYANCLSVSYGIFVGCLLHVGSLLSVLLLVMALFNVRGALYYGNTVLVLMILVLTSLVVSIRVTPEKGFRGAAALVDRHVALWAISILVWPAVAAGFYVIYGPLCK